ncbi:MAG: hypothetical protein PHY54_16615 [Methylococcales bacterium]|nr:hypothetical protein [Methylococcales bacterium]
MSNIVVNTTVKLQDFVINGTMAWVKNSFEFHETAFMTWAIPDNSVGVAAMKKSSTHRVPYYVWSLGKVTTCVFWEMLLSDARQHQSMEMREYDKEGLPNVP